MIISQSARIEKNIHYSLLIIHLEGIAFAAPIEQVPLNNAPGSTMSVLVLTSPTILPLARSDNF